MKKRVEIVYDLSVEAIQLSSFVVLELGVCSSPEKTDT